MTGIRIVVTAMRKSAVSFETLQSDVNKFYLFFLLVRYRNEGKFSNLFIFLSSVILSIFF